MDNTITSFDRFPYLRNLCPKFLRTYLWNSKFYILSISQIEYIFFENGQFQMHCLCFHYFHNNICWSDCHTYIRIDSCNISRNGRINSDIGRKCPLLHLEWVNAQHIQFLAEALIAGFCAFVIALGFEVFLLGRYFFIKKGLLSFVFRFQIPHLACYFQIRLLQVNIFRTFQG